MQATDYATEAEIQGEAAVFIQPTQDVAGELTWWKLASSHANWRQPSGLSSKPIADNEPV